MEYPKYFITPNRQFTEYSHFIVCNNKGDTISVKKNGDKMSHEWNIKSWENWVKNGQATEISAAEVVLL